MMKSNKIFNTTKKEIESKKFNIFIGISLGNKWFTKENLRKYLHWALKRTKEKVLFLIADKIHTINYNVRNKRCSKENNLKRALRNGKQIEEFLEELISELPSEQRQKVKILRWEEYEKSDKFYKEFTPIIYKEFESNLEFRTEVLKLIKSSIKDRKFSDEEYLQLSKYLLEEFFALYSGINYNSVYYGFYIYPQDTPISHFIEKLQQRKIFSELNKKLPKEKVALVTMNNE